MAVARYGYKVWAPGDVITAQKLNAISSALEDVTTEIVDDKSVIISNETETEIKNNYPNNKIWYNSENGSLKLKNITNNNYVEVNENQKTIAEAVSKIENVGSLNGKIVMSNALNLPIHKLDVFLDINQDLHGEGWPWPGGTDDNKLPMILSDIKNANTAGTWNNNNYTYNGITYTILLDEDNNVTGIKANGTASGNSTFKVGNKTWSNISSEDYQLGGCAKNGSITTYYLALGANPITDKLIVDTGLSYFLQNYRYESNATNHNVWIAILNNTTVSDIIFTPIVVLTNYHSTNKFKPYENICPFKKYDVVNIYRTGKNLLDPSIIEEGGYTTTGEVSPPSDSPRERRHFSITLLPGTYTFSTNEPKSYIPYYLLNDTPFNPTTGPFDQPNTVTFTISVISELKMQVAKQYGNEGFTEPYIFQLEENNEKTEYESYNLINILSINVKQINANNDVYGGKLTINEDNSGTLTINNQFESLQGKTFSELQLWPSSNLPYIVYTTQQYIAEKTEVLCNKLRAINLTQQIGVAWSCCPYELGTTNQIAIFGEPDSTREEIIAKLSDAIICYQVVNPFTYNFTKEQIKTKTGNNYIYSNCPHFSIDYYVEKYLDSSVPIRKGGAYGSIIEGSITTRENYNYNINVASAQYSHAEGSETQARGLSSHAEGNATIANGIYSHAQGRKTNSSGFSSHAEGLGCQSRGMQSHAEGQLTLASGVDSHAEGYQTIANRRCSHVFGVGNIIDSEGETTNDFGNYIEIVGNGTEQTSGSSIQVFMNRSNARTLDWEGNEALAGKLTLGLNTSNEASITPNQLKTIVSHIDIIPTLVTFIQLLDNCTIEGLDATQCFNRIIRMVEHWTGGQFGDNSNDFGTQYTPPPPEVEGAGPITKQPTNRTAKPDALTVFNIETDDAATITGYQWQYSTNSGMTWQDCAEGFTGPRSIRVLFKATTEKNNWQFRVKVTTPQGIFTSTSATLTVSES